MNNIKINLQMYIENVFMFMQGYLFVSVLIAESHELMPLIIQAIRNDLESRNPIYTTLAMQCIANVASKAMTAELGQEVPKILVSP